MNDEIEIVARALANREHSYTGGADGQALVRGTPNWKFCVDAAKDAIAALDQHREGKGHAAAGRQGAYLRAWAETPAVKEALHRDTRAKALEEIAETDAQLLP